MVVAVRELSIIHVLAHGLGSLEVKCGAGHKRQLASRDKQLVNRRVLARIDLHNVILDVPVSGALEVEIAVIGEIYNCVSVRNRRVVDNQGVAVGQGVLHADFQGSGVILLAVRADVAERNGRLVAIASTVHTRLL